MTLYRLKKECHKQPCGDHVEVDKDGKQHTIKPGETFESHRDLIAKFCKGKSGEQCKFEKVHPDDEPTPDESPRIPSPGAIADTGGKDDATSPPSIHPEFGEDITSEFPLAKEKEVKVYVKKHWCQIIDETEDGEEVLNDSKLRKKHVKKFLEELEEVDDEDVEEDEDGEGDGEE